MKKIFPLITFFVLLLIPQGIQSVSAQSFDLTGLKAYWKFEETSGPLKMHSISEYSTDSVADVGMTKSVTGKIGNAWMFGTGATRIEIGNADDWRFHQGHQKPGWTHNLWAKTIDNGVNRGAIFSNGGLSGTGGKNLLIQADYGGSHTRSWHIDNAILPNSPFSLQGDDEVLPTDNQWHMLTFTKDLSASAGSGNNFPFKTYVDGVLLDTKKFNGGTGSENYLVLGNQCGPFCTAWDSDMGYENTPVDEWSVWSRVLSDSEIVALYNNGQGLELDVTNEMIGGKIIPIDWASLLLAGAQISFVWVLPPIIAGAGLVAFSLRRK